ncbi:MAG: pheT [Acidimicrobiaceae bacterium]|nr:pheT [Acidimicrobiaceae bacterium]
MRVPLSWLREFTPLPTDARDREAVRRLGRVLDSLGLVVEGIEHVGGGLEDVVLARVLDIRPIEGADRIREVLVDAGGPEPLTIVCGAMNFVTGDVVPLAKVGAELPGGFVIGRRKMRGIVSDGMLCSGPELGIGQDAAGLMLVASTGSPDAPLPAGLELGAPLADYLGIEPDAVFDLAVEPNRPDGLSIIGVARDLAARLGLPFEVSVPSPVTSGPPASELASLELQAPDACRHMLARVVSGVANGVSPPLVARRLLLAGMRPLGAVVDASNYVMLELGQPNHPYDLDTLGGHGLSVRFARPGERLVTLDGTERLLGRHVDALGGVLEVEDLLICDAKDTAVGLAGIMGGAATEIGESTSRVLLEVAEFAPLVVGRTAKRQGVRSEASARFERGIDPAGLERAADRFCELLAAAAAYAGAAAPVVAPGDLDEHPRPSETRRVRLRLARANALLGTALSVSRVQQLLTPIGFGVDPANTGETAPDGASTPGETTGEAALDTTVLEVTVPSFRPDVQREVDVVEEIARHHGYERITPTRRRSPNVGNLGARNVTRRRLRRLMTGLGAHEAWTSSIVDPSLHVRAGSHAGVVELANPMVQEESVLRSHLLLGLLGSLRHNVSHRNPAVRLFELGRVFSPSAAGEGLPVEHEHLGLLLGGDGDDASAAVRAWRVLVDGLGLDAAALQLEQGPSLGPDVGALAIGVHPSRRGLVLDAATKLQPVAVIGEVDPEVLDSFGLSRDRRVGWMVVDLEQLETLPTRSDLARPVSRFPSSDIDLAFLLGEETPAGDLEEVLRESAGELCESVRLLDAYRGPGVPEGARSLAYRVRFCALDRTLTDVEVAELRARCIAEVESKLPATLRR